MTQPIERITSLADLRPGDIMLGPIGGIIPGLFPVGVGQAMLMDTFRIGPVSIRHAGIVVEAGEREGASPAEVASELFPDLVWKTTRDDRPAVRGPRLVQAMPHGAEEIELTPERHWKTGYGYVRIPEDYPGQAADAAAIARLMVGTPYSLGSYLALAAWHFGLKASWLERQIDARRDPVLFPLPSGKGFQSDGKRDDLASLKLPKEMICSVLVDQAWSLAGKRVCEGVARQAVTPGKLAGSLWAMSGTVWKFAP